MPLGNPIRKQNESRIVSVLATEGQTVFTVQGGYIVNHISVFRNGVRLSNSEDFTAGDGSTVTLNNAANIEDRIEFHVFDRFTVQNAIIGAASTQTINGDLVLNGKLFGALDVPSINLTGIVTATELDINGNANISGVSTFQNNVHLLDSDRLQIGGSAGTVDGIELYHDGSHSYIQDSGTGELRLRTNVFNVQNNDGSETLIGATENDSVALYFNNSQKLVTTNTGAIVTGILTATDFSGAGGAAADFPNGLTATIGTFTGDVSVAGDFQVPDVIKHEGDVNTKIRFPSNDTITFETGGSERLRIASDGSLLLGTTVANERVHIHTASSAKAQIQITNTTTGTSSSDGFTFGITGGEEVVFANQENTAMYFSTNNVERLRITSGGNVNIGNSLTQTSRLFTAENTLADGGEIAYIGNNDGASNYGGLIISAGETDRECRLESAWGNSFMTFYTNAGTATEKMRLTSGGTFGVGTNGDPDERVHFEHDGNISLLVECSGSGGGANAAFRLKSADSSSDWYMQTGNVVSGDLRFYSGAERMRLTSGGRLGLGGVTSPDELLHLKSTAVAGACIELDYNGTYKSQIKTNSDAMEIRAPQAMNFYTGNNDGASSTIRLNIDNTGRLRINGATTTAKISMNVSDGSTLGGNSDGIRINSGTPNCQFVRLGTSYSYHGVSGSGGASMLYSYDALRILADTSNPITFHTGGALRMHILANGRIYMGTTNTQQHDQNKVVVAGTKAFSAGIVQQQLTIVDENAYNVSNNGGSIGFQAQYHSNGSYTQMACIQGNKENNNSADYGGSFSISTRQNNGNMIEGLHIGSGGGPCSIRSQLYCNSELNLFKSDSTPSHKYMDIGYLNHVFYIRRTNGGDGGHSVQMSITSAGVISGDFNDTSDEKLKENIASVSDGSLALVKQLRPVTFDWKDSTRGNNQAGFIAQEVKTVIPNLVNGEEYDETKVNEKGQIISTGYSINTTGIIAHLTKALQELSAKNDALEARIAALEGS